MRINPKVLSRRFNRVIYLSYLGLLIISCFMFSLEYNGIYNNLIKNMTLYHQLQCRTLDVAEADRADSPPYKNLDLTKPERGFSLIMDGSHNVLKHSHAAILAGADFESMLPETLMDDKAEIQTIPESTMVEIDDHFVFRHQIKDADLNYYTFVKVIDIKSEAFYESVDTLAIVFLALTGLLLILQFMIRTEFLRPSQKLVEHIELESSGIESRANMSPGWMPIAETVSTAFKQNRELMAEKQNRIENLDEAVKARTAEIIEKNQELEQSLDNLEKAQDQIIMQEKMASLGSLTAGIAHEMKNPLNFIINFSEVSKELVKDLRAQISPLLEKGNPAAKTEVEEVSQDLTENMDRIKHHGERADQIVRSMLMHSRNGETEQNNTDLNELVTENISLALSGFRGNHPDFSARLKTNFDRNLKPVMISDQGVARVVLNVLNNACYALWQRKRQHPNNYEPVLTVTTRDLGDQVEIVMKDNGTGISPEKLKRVMEPFFTTKPTGEGTGLGLSMCYDIITNQNRGTFEIESESDKYTEVTVKLPK